MYKTHVLLGMVLKRSTLSPLFISFVLESAIIRKIVNKPDDYEIWMG